MFTSRLFKSGVLTVAIMGLCSLGNAAYGKKKQPIVETPAVSVEVPVIAVDVPVVSTVEVPTIPSMTQEDMMTKMKEAASPNENHKVLDGMAGSWDYTMLWWQASGAEPQISTGASEAKWIMGGRFLQQMVTGTAMGQPFEGMGINGYDNIKKEYTSVWIDNMGTGIMSSKSSYDAATKTFSEKGSFSCPLKGGDMSFRGMIQINDENTYTYQMYMSGPDGVEMKSMELVYKRK